MMKGRFVTAIVNSHDEWSVLEEVIVGAPFDLDYHADVSFRLFFHDNLKAEFAVLPHGYRLFYGKLTNQLKDECVEDLETLLGILKTADVIVRRPEVLTEAKLITAPHWSAPMGHAFMSRDLFLVIGDEIIETSPMVRARYFEADLYKELFTEYFRAGARWTVAPKSRLMERNFDYSYVLETGYTGEVPSDPAYEMMFDGAQLLRFGRDLLFNVSTENHRLGATWLQRHLGDSYRVHVTEVTDHHIDGKIMPLRPGVLLVRRGVRLELLPPALQKWDVIWYDDIDVPTEMEVDGVPLLASQSIGMNVLSLDPERVIVQDIQVPLMQKLEEAGFTPIPCRWRHGRRMGGGFHCVTLDIRRQSSPETYF